jgi:tetratricopeptide (TPR) repeat protein
MTPPLPSEGPHRAIFVQALREFSANCATPALSPACPFYNVGERGPWCLEECMDLLAEHRDNSLDGVEILEGFRVIPAPRRPRRGFPSPVRPFDAAEIHLADSRRPINEWRTAALLAELRVLSTPPLYSRGLDLAGRAARIAAVFERFDEMGLDGERLLRAVFVPAMAQAVVTITALPLLLTSQEDINQLPPDLVQTLDGWPHILMSEDRSPEGWFAVARERGDAWTRDQVGTIFRQAGRVTHWLSLRPLNELLEWRAPVSVDFAAVPQGGAPKPNPEDRWVADRFMQTYLEQWSYESLLLEWAYLHGDRVAPCGPEAMRSRHVPAEELANAIAWRAARGEEGRRTNNMTVAQFVEPALAHLRAGQFATAAAIFDACRIAAPNDGEAHNNYGFCILPIDPGAALEALERAADLGMRLALVNTANRMLAAYRLGRAGTALEIASRAAASTAWKSPAFGWLWNWEPGTPKLVELPDVRFYIAEFAISIARDSGEPAANRSWSARLGDLNP